MSAEGLRSADLRILAAALSGWRAFANHYGSDRLYCAERPFAGAMLELRAPTVEGLIAACRDFDRRAAS